VAIREKALKEEQQALLTSAGDTGSLDKHAAFYRDAMANVLGFVEAQKIQREVIGDVVAHKANRYVLDGSEISPRISQQFVVTWERELSRGHINPFQGHSIELVNLVKIWRMSLHQLCHSLNTGATTSPSLESAPRLSAAPNFDHFSGETVVEIEKQSGYLQTLKGFKAHLKTTLQQIHGSIETLSPKESSNMKLDGDDSNLFGLYGGVGFTSYCPPLDFRIQAASLSDHWLDFNPADSTSSSSSFSFSFLVFLVHSSLTHISCAGLQFNHQEAWFLESLDPTRVREPAETVGPKVGFADIQPVSSNPEEEAVQADRPEEARKPIPKKSVSFTSAVPAPAPPTSSQPANKKAPAMKQPTTMSALSGKVSSASFDVPFGPANFISFPY